MEASLCKQEEAEIEPQNTEQGILNDEV